MEFVRLDAYGLPLPSARSLPPESLKGQQCFLHEGFPNRWACAASTHRYRFFAGERSELNGGF